MKLQLLHFLQLIISDIGLGEEEGLCKLGPTKFDFQFLILYCILPCKLTSEKKISLVELSTITINVLQINYFSKSNIQLKCSIYILCSYTI